MRITSDIIKDLNSIDLSSKVKIADRYEELSSSPVLLPMLRLKEGKAPYIPNGKPIESFMEIARAEIRHYASTKRDRLNEATLSMIKKRLAVILAKWEREWEKAEQAGTTQEDFGMGYIWHYARERGLSDCKQPITEEGIAALDDTAHRILSIFESYFLYSFTPKEGFSMTETNNEEAIEENRRELDLAFAEEWNYKVEGEYTTSFEEEVQYFSVEYDLYLEKVLETILRGVHSSSQLTGLSSDEDLYSSDREAIDLQRAKESRYKDYLTIND